MTRTKVYKDLELPHQKMVVLQRPKKFLWFKWWSTFVSCSGKRGKLLYINYYDDDDNWTYSEMK